MIRLHHTRPVAHFACVALLVVSCSEEPPTGEFAGRGEALVTLNNDPNLVTKKGGGKPGEDPAPSDWAWVFRGAKSVQIALLTFDGATTKTLTSDRHPKIAPAFSSDGSKVAYVKFISQGNSYWTEIRVVNIDGSGDKAVLSVTAQPEWNGSLAWLPGESDEKILYEGQYGVDLFVVDANGDSGQTPQALGISPSHDWMHTFSVGRDTDPAGGFQGYIAYGARTDGITNGVLDLHVVKVERNPSGDYVGAADPASIVRLDLPDPYENGGQAFPSFSPDGSQIAFVESSGSNRGEEIKVVDFDAETGTFVDVPSGITSITTALVFHRPTWSPDGSLLAFSWRREVPCANGTADLYVVNVSTPGAPPTAVSCTRYWELRPNWNPAWIQPNP